MYAFRFKFMLQFKELSKSNASHAKLLDPLLSIFKEYASKRESNSKFFEVCLLIIQFESYQNELLFVRF